MQMNKLFKYILPSLALALGVVSCNDTMDDKADIDARYARNNAPSVTLNSVSTNALTISASVTLSDSTDVLEKGIQYATNKNFIGASSLRNTATGLTFTATTAKLTASTKYYVRGYAYTKGAGTAVSSIDSVTTAAAASTTSAQ